jgi:hypothetical protein
VNGFFVDHPPCGTLADQRLLLAYTAAVAEGEMTAEKSGKMGKTTMTISR